MLQLSPNNWCLCRITFYPPTKKVIRKKVILPVFIFFFLFLLFFLLVVPSQLFGYPISTPMESCSSRFFFSSSFFLLVVSFSIIWISPIHSNGTVILPVFFFFFFLFFFFAVGCFILNYLDIPYPLPQNIILPGFLFSFLFMFLLLLLLLLLVVSFSIIWISPIHPHRTNLRSLHDSVMVHEFDTIWHKSLIYPFRHSMRDYQSLIKL